MRSSHRAAAVLAILLVIQTPVLTACRGGGQVSREVNQGLRDGTKKIPPIAGGGVAVCSQSDSC
jgi:hypothetical protein